MCHPEIFMPGSCLRTAEQQHNDLTPRPPIKHSHREEEWQAKFQPTSQTEKCSLQFLCWFCWEPHFLGSEIKNYHLNFASLSSPNPMVNQPQQWHYQDLSSGVAAKPCVNVPVASCDLFVQAAKAVPEFCMFCLHLAMIMLKGSSHPNTFPFDINMNRSLLEFSQWKRLKNRNILLWETVRDTQLLRLLQ